VLFHLAEPAALLGILLALLIGIYAHDAAQVVAAKLFRDPRPLRSGRLTASMKHRISPFSAVAMIIAGVGWTEPISMNDVWRKRRFHVAAALLAGPVAYLLLTFGAVIGISARDSHTVYFSGARDFSMKLLLWLAITFASLFIVSLIPVPPADGGRVLFGLGPQSPGWRRADYQLRENNIGIAVLLALILLPKLFSGFPSVVDQLVPPLLSALGSIINLELRV
jgi:Zn-dependent protease